MSDDKKIVSTRVKTTNNEKRNLIVFLIVGISLLAIVDYFYIFYKYQEDLIKNIKVLFLSYWLFNNVIK